VLFAGFTSSCKKNDDNDIISKSEIVELRNSNFCRQAQGLGCTIEFRTGIPVVIQGCTLFANYTITRCTSGTQITVSIDDFNYTFGTSSACNLLRNQLNSAYFANSFSQFYNTYYNPFYKAMSIEIEKYEAQLLIAQNLLPDCGTGSSAIIEWISSGCYKACAIPVGEDGYDLIDVKCGDGCCYRTTSYCNFNGTPKSQGSQVISLRPCGTLVPNACDENQNNNCQPACAKL